MDKKHKKIINKQLMIQNRYESIRDFRTYFKVHFKQQSIRNEQV